MQICVLTSKILQILIDQILGESLRWLLSWHRCLKAYQQPHSPESYGPYCIMSVLNTWPKYATENWRGPRHSNPFITWHMENISLMCSTIIRARGGLDLRGPYCFSMMTFLSQIIAFFTAWTYPKTHSLNHQFAPNFAYSICGHLSQKLIRRILIVH